MTLNYYVLFTRYLKVKTLTYKMNLLALLCLYCLVMAKANQIYAQAKRLTLGNKGKIMVFVIVIFFDNVINPLGELEI